MLTIFNFPRRSGKTRLCKRLLLNNKKSIAVFVENEIAKRNYIKFVNDNYRVFALHNIYDARIQLSGLNIDTLIFDDSLNIIYKYELLAINELSNMYNIIIIGTNIYRKSKFPLSMISSTSDRIFHSDFLCKIIKIIFDISNCGIVI